MEALRFSQQAVKLCFRFILLGILVFNSGPILFASARRGAPAALTTTTHCGTISSNQTWSSSGNVHLLTCNVIVAQGVTLTIAQGTIVKINLNYRLTINGKLLVQGTGAAPAIITSYRDDEYGGDTNQDGPSVCSAGDWDGIFLVDTSDDASSVDHALVRCVGDNYYARAGINFDHASPTVQNSEFRQSAYCALHADLHSFPHLNGNIYNNNAGNGLCLLPAAGESIDTNATWAPIDTSYYLRGNITVIQGKTLTLSPGIVVKVGLNNRLTINGTLLVQGIGLAPVVISSYRDDEYGIGNNWDTDGGGPSVCSPGDWDGIFFVGSNANTSAVNHALVRCVGDGYYARAGINFDNASPTVQNSEFRQSAYCALRADLHSFPILSENTYASNAGNGLCLLPESGEAIDTNATWSPIDTSYYLRGNITVVLGRTLTLSPGIVVKVGLNNNLTINGKLLVQGTGVAPAVITSYRDDEFGIGSNWDTDGGGPSVCSPGDWDGIFFTETSDPLSVVDHALVRCVGDGYYARAGINFNNASPTVQNSEFRQSAYCALRADLHSFPILTGNTYNNNSGNGLCLLAESGEAIDTNVTWSPIDTSYYLRSNITVVLGKTLTLSPDIVVKVGLNNRLTINGKLLVQGTGAAPVIITSYRDDQYGKGNNWDTDGGGPSNCSADDWDGIYFNDTSDDASVVDHALVHCAGDGYYVRAAINLDHASPHIQNSDLTNNVFGMVADTSTPVLGCNNIYGNSNYGLYNKTPSVIVNAGNQWWGSASGPYHPTLNPAGTGNKVSDGVDFNPYRTSPCGPPTNIDVFIGGAKQDSYYVRAHESRRQSYTSVNNGPVQIINTIDDPSVASQRVIFGGKSYSEMMGLPLEQLSKEYWFPYYNNVAMDSQLRVSNLGGVPTTITVYLGTQQIDSFSLGGGGAVRKNYAGKNGGPLKVTSFDTKILSTIRVLFNGNSYSEMMGLPLEQLSKEYWFPYYNNVAMDSQLRVSNLGNGPTTITVYLGTQPIDSYTLAGGTATRKNYVGKNGGPLKVTSSATNILSTIRVLYVGSSYSEMMGLPVNQLAQEHWYPVYDNSALDSQFRVSNVGTGPTTITVYAGETQIDSYTLNAGAATRKNYSQNTGPLHVVSNPEPILSTIRMLYTTPSFSSFYEMMGLPNTQLSTQYFFPWYNNVAMSSELRFAVP